MQRSIIQRIDRGAGRRGAGGRTADRGRHSRRAGAAKLVLESERSPERRLWMRVAPDARPPGGGGAAADAAHAEDAERMRRRLLEELNVELYGP